MRNMDALQVDADEELSVSYDYFRMLRAGIVDAHTRAGWRSFRAGYHALGKAFREAARDERAAASV
jgi:hypothetical protein